VIAAGTGVATALGEGVELPAGSETLAPIIAPSIPTPKNTTISQPTNFVNELVNRCPHFGQNVALLATSFPHLHLHIVAPVRHCKASG